MFLSAFLITDVTRDDGAGIGILFLITAFDCNVKRNAKGLNAITIESSDRELFRVALKV